MIRMAKCKIMVTDECIGCTACTNVSDNFKIDNLKFVFSGRENLDKAEFACGNQCGECLILDKGETKTYYCELVLCNRRGCESIRSISARDRGENKRPNPF